MDDKFLQEFLKTGLFDVGDSDDRLKWLQVSINDLRKKFEQDLSILPKYALVAFDPNISDEDPIMNEAEAIITDNWNALRAKYVEMPRNLIRGVIINALNSIGIANPIAARIIFLTAGNFYPYAKLNSERKIVEEMLNKLGEIAEKDAIDEWSFIEEEPKLKIGTLKVSGLKFDPIEFDKSKLKSDLKIAIGNESQTGYGSANGGDSQWGTHFASKSTEAISTALETALESFGQSLNPASVENPINKFFVEFKKSLDSNMKIAFSSLKAVERRSKLLWWKETLYSPSLKRNYRDLNNYQLSVLMSIDLDSQVPAITPISVDYLLKDTLFLINNKKDDSISFLSYLTEISNDENKSLLKKYFSTWTAEEDRISITDFIALLINDRAKIEEFSKKTGIESSEEITLCDISTVILHDLLVKRLIAE